MTPDSGTQLSFLNENKGGKQSVVTARMALNILGRLMENARGVSSQSAVYFKAVFRAVVEGAEQLNGLPVSKSTIRPLLLNPITAISKRPPTRPDEFIQMETLLDFVQRRLSSPSEKSHLEQHADELLGSQNPELLITPEGIASPLFAQDRHEASQLFSPLLGDKSAETAEALIEAYVLLRANLADVQTGISKLFWREDINGAEAQHYIDGCADGQARAYFRALLALPSERQRALLSTINLETYYAAFGSKDGSGKN